MENLIILNIIILVSAFVQAFTGFGFALIATPILFFFIDPKIAIVLIVCVGTFILIGLTVVYRKHIDVRRALYLSAGSLIGIPAGSYLLSVLSPTHIKIVVACVVIVLSVLLMANRFPYLRPFRFWHLTIGGVGGLLTTSTSMGGPPLVLFLLSQNLTKNEFLGTISATGCVASVFSIGLYGVMGLIDGEILKISAAALPMLALGLFLGTLALRKIDNKRFRYLAIAIVFASAINTIVTTLAG